MSRLLTNYKLDTTLWRDCSRFITRLLINCGYVHNFVIHCYTCKELALYALSGLAKSSQQHPNQPQVLHHQCSLPFHSVNRRKNHAGDDGTLPTYVI